MTPRWWICPDDPEAGYIDADDGETVVVRGRGALRGGHHAYADGRRIGEVIPAPCSICSGKVPDDAANPLCARCESTAIAHARLEREAAVQREEGVGRG